MQLREMFENEWTNWRRRHTFNNVKSFTRSNSSSKFIIINRLISITLVHLFISLALVNVTTAATATAQSGVSSQSPPPSLSKLQTDISSSKVSNNPKSIMMSNRSITIGVLGKNVTGMGKKSSLSAAKMASLKGKNKPRPIPTVTITPPAKYSNQSNLLNNQPIGVNGNSSSLIDDLAARNRRQLCKLGF